VNDLTIFQFVLAFVGSFIAGAINTLAGNGSLITLTLLTDLIGLPGNLANGTNRVGVFLQSAASSFGFRKHKLLNIKESKTIIIWTMVGAISGVYVATIVSNEQFMFVFKYLMLVMLVVILVKPQRWIHNSEPLKLPYWVSIPAFFALGFYGGFIQMGMGIFFIAVLVLLARFDIMTSNAIKTFIVALYTIIVLLIFAYHGLVDWKIGFLMAIGQSIGGYLTAAYGTGRKDISLWAYRLLVFIVIFALLMQFDIITF